MTASYRGGLLTFLKHYWSESHQLCLSALSSTKDYTVIRWDSPLARRHLGLSNDSNTIAIPPPTGGWQFFTQLSHLITVWSLLLQHMRNKNDNNTVERSADYPSSFACYTMATADTGDAAPELEAAPASLKSPVWKYFAFPVSYVDDVRVVDKKTTVCKLCYARVPHAATSNTTNMAGHIRRHHKDVDLTGKTPSLVQPTISSSFEYVAHLLK